MRKFRFRSILVLLAALSLLAAACGGDDEPTDPAAGATGGDTTGSGACADADTSAGDLLAQICSEGVITVSTDPAYPPQSSLNPALTDSQSSRQFGDRAPLDMKRSQ